MNLRAIGCIGAGAIVFVAIGLIGLNMAITRTGCPGGLRWEALTYEPAGTPAPSPDLGETAPPVSLGTTFIGLTTREVYGPAGTSPSSAPSTRPDRLALACGDGTFLTYRLVAGASPASQPGSPAP